MKKAIVIAFLFCYIYSGAQDTTPKRLNLTIDYSIGLQFFKLDGMENLSRKAVRDNLPGQGFYDEPNFKPMVLQHISVAATIFKNKTYYLGAHVCWGKNEITSYGYSSDQLGNPYRVSGNAFFSIAAIGLGIQKEISLKHWGILVPGISFYSQGNERRITSYYQVRDKTTGNIISQGENSGSGGLSGNTREGILMLFDNPRIGLDYKVTIYKNLSFMLSYSYWLVGSMINDFYGLSNSYIIKFKGYKNVLPIRERPYPYDLYSHNISVGLCFHLRK